MGGTRCNDAGKEEGYWLCPPHKKKEEEKCEVNDELQVEYTEESQECFRLFFGHHNTDVHQLTQLMLNVLKIEIDETKLFERQCDNLAAVEMDSEY